MDAFSQKLAPEIFTQIFEWLYFISISKPEPNHDLVDGKHVRQLCWPVSQVCRYWRQVALAAPFLWTHLPTIILDENPAFPSPDQQLERLQALIPRTRNRALHISAVRPDYSEYDWCLAVVDYITGYCERWGTFALRAGPEDLELLGAIRGRLPCLEILKLDIHEGDEGGINVFLEVPNLKFVHITGGYTGALQFDTQALVHLRDDTSGIMHNLYPTHGYSQLTTLKVIDTRGSSDYSDLSVDHDVILFPALKTLYYSATRKFLVEDGFLKFAKTPALEELSLFAYAGDVLECLTDLKSRSGSLLLKSVCLEIEMDSDWIEDDFPGILRLFPELTTLVVNLPRVDKIPHLAISQGPDTLVPGLRKCTFLLNWFVDHEIHRAIAGMAESRCNQPQISCPTADISEVLTIDKADAAVYMQLCLQQDLSSRADSSRAPAGIGYYYYPRPKLDPMELESWYEPKINNHEVRDADSEDQYIYGECCPSQIQTRTQSITKNPYTKVTSEISTLMSPVARGIHNLESHQCEHLFQLIGKLADEYNSENLVDFLAANTSLSLLYLAYVLKDHSSRKARKSKSNYPCGQLVRLISKVKLDLQQNLDKFHWIWEIYHTVYILQYIHDHHEIRTDSDKFANAILGLNDDLWIFEDF